MVARALYQSYRWAICEGDAPPLLGSGLGMGGWLIRSEATCLD